MNEINKQNLEKAIRNLPDSEPEPILWNKIEAFLQFEEQVSKVIGQLPVYEPVDGVWAEIDTRIVYKGSKKISVYKIARYCLAAAASILLVFLGWQVLKPKQKEGITISYSIENKKLIDSLPNPGKAVKDSENYIKQSCSKLPDRCESPDISSLKNELENLNAQYKKLQDAAERYGTDENIMQATIKIETTKSKVMKEIISKLKS